MKSKTIMLALVAGAIALYGQNPLTTELKQNYAQIKATVTKAADDMPEARTAIANRILAEFKSAKRLCPQALEEEFKTLRQIANRVVLGIGKYLSHEDLIAAFTLRSKRLIIHETLGEHMAGANAPDEKLERLLFVEENIIGAENKRLLATFVLPILTSSSFDAHPERLIAQLQDVNDEIAPLMKPTDKLYFRAPYGSWRSAHAAMPPPFRLWKRC